MSGRCRYLRECLQTSGLVLHQPPKACEINEDTIVIVQRIKITLQKHYDYPRNVEDVVRDLKDECDNVSVFRHYLFPNVQRIEEESCTRAITDSVFKILLCVTPLQDKIAELLFEKLIDLAVEGDCQPWIRSFLNCFTTLDHIVSPNKIAAKLIDLLDVTTEKVVRLEIITTLPDIIGDTEHENVASEMSRFLSEQEELTPAILDCLSYLCLSDHQYQALQTKAIGILRTSIQYQYYPNFVKFLLMSGRLDEAGYLQTVNELRRTLSWPAEVSEEICSSQMLTALAIRNTVTSSKIIASAWVKSVSSCKLPSDHKPLDIVLLLILFSTSDERQKLVENLIRKHLKFNVLQEHLVDEAFHSFSPMMKHYLQNMLDLVNNLLKFKSDNFILLFASHWYTAMFENLKENRQMITAVLLQHGLSCKQSMSGALVILKKIAEKDIKMLVPQSVKMLSLLDKLDDLTLNEVRETMNILSGLAFSSSNSVIRDDMHMIIKKQLESSNPALKVKGILAAVQAIKYLVRGEEFGDNDIAKSEDIDYGCYNHLAEGDTREAAQIIELISKSTQKFPDIFGFFYDELAEVLLCADYINPSFLSWLTDAVTNDLQQNFMVSDIPVNKINNIEYSMQYSINNEEELDCVIAINIAELVLKKTDDDCAEISLLPSLCRLVQLLHSKKNEGDLGDIDALLGCAVIMPKVDMENFIKNADHCKIFFVLDCMIHCNNWFRELINGFALQKEDSLKQKIIHRIRNIEEIELMINNILVSVDALYKSPPSTSNVSKYITDQREHKRVAKAPPLKPNKKVKLDDTHLPATSKTQASQVGNNNLNIKCKLSAVQTLPLRQFNLNVINLLNADIDFEGVDNKFMDIKSFAFIVRHIHSNISSVMISQFQKISHFSKQNHNDYDQKKAESTAEKIHVMLPKLMMHLEDIINKINRISENNKEIDYYTEEIIDLQESLQHLFSVFATFFKWIEFRKQNHPLLKSSLRVVVSKTENSSKLKSFKELLISAAKFFQSLEDHCVLVPTAVSLIEVVKAFFGISESEAISKILKNMANSFLSREWMTTEGIPEKGLTFNRHVESVTCTYFTNPDITALKTLALEIKTEIDKLTGKNDHLSFMKSITKSNFPILYKHTVGAVHLSAKTKIDKGITDSQHLELWKDVSKTLKVLAEIAKVIENRNNLSAFLKKSQPVFKLFMSQGMPMMEMKLKTESQTVIEIFKELQYSTKFLQTLCCHSRLKSDSTLMAKVPQVRLLLEQFIYKVKAALAANNCSEAFWMGNLKNKNLHGEVIASQESICEENGEDSDAQLPEDNDDSEDDDEMLQPDSKSISDIN